MRLRFFALTVLFFTFFLSKSQVVNNIGVSAIDSPLTSFCGTSVNLYVQVTNYGINQVDSFMLNFSINGVLQPSVKKVMLLDTLGGTMNNQASLSLGMLALRPGLLTTITVWTSLPNGLADSIPTDDSLAITRTATKMEGAYTVNPADSGSQNFTTLDSAISALTTLGICGPVMINIAPGMYTRTTALSIGNIPGTDRNNRVTIKSSGMDSCLITGNIDSSAILRIDQANYITVRDLSIINTSVTTPVALSIRGITNKISVISCKLQVPESTNLAPLGGYAINFSGAMTDVNASISYSDSSVVDSNKIIGGFYGVAYYGASNALYNRNLVISNNNIMNTTFQGISLYYMYNAVAITGNTVVMGTSPLQGTSTGIQFFSNINTSVQSHIISNNRVIGFNNYGIYCFNTGNATSSSPLVITNNVIIGEKPQQSTAMYGLRVNQIANIPVQVYHNTVVVSSNMVTGQNQAAFYTDGTSLATIKNNIFVVKSGVALPAYIVTNLPQGQVNHNLYHNANASGYLIHKAGSLFNASNYKISAIGGDSSYNSFPAFVNPDLDNYMLRHGCIKGTNLQSTISTDINGKLRSTTPLIGAYEFEGGIANISMLDILKPAGLDHGLQELKIRVINSGSTPLSSYRASYSLNNGPAVSLVKTLTLEPCSIDTMIFNDSNSILISDSQYVMAWVDTISSVDTEKESDTLRVSLLSGLKGIYTVGGTTPDFSTPQEAIAALEARGLSGHVTLDMRPGSYAGQLTITSLPGLCDTASLTIDGYHADSVSITGNMASGILFFDQVSHVRVRNVAISNTSTLSNTYGIWVYCPNRVSNIKISGCKISVPLVTSGRYALLVSGQTASSGSFCDSLLVDSNIISGGISGLLINGSSNTIYNKGIVISRNTIRNVSTGIEAKNIYNPVTIAGSNIEGAIIGISFTSNKSQHNTQAHRLTANRIRYFAQNGIQYSFSSGISTSARAIIANNELVSQGTTSVVSGIAITNASDEQIGIYHNTVIMRGASTSNSRGAVYYSGSAHGEIRNNVLVVTKGNYYPVYVLSTLNNNMLNYNLYYNTSTTSTLLVYRTGTTYNATNYRAANAGGDSSFNRVPTFTSMDSATLDLHLLSKCVVNGINVPEVSDDLLGVTRTLPAALGAYEPSSPAASISVESIIEPIFDPTLFRGTYTMKVIVRNEGSAPLMQYAAGYTNTNTALVNITRTTGLAPCQLDTVEFSGPNSLEVRANNQIKAFVSLSGNDPYRNDDTLVKVFYPVMKGSYTIGLAPGNDFSTMSQAVSALNSRGIVGAVTFELQPGTYTGAVEIGGTIPGLSKQWDVTFDGRWKDSVSFVADTSGAVILVNKVKYIKLRNLSVENKQSTLGIAIAGNNLTTMLGTGCEISNCNVRLPALSGAASSGTCISINGSTNGIGTSKTSIDSILIDSNTITGGAYGIAFYGGQVTSSNRGIAVRHNTIDSCNWRGISINGIYNPLPVADNIINMNAGLVNSTGISFSGNRASSGTHSITRNQVYNFGYSGISCDYPSGSATADVHITNNIVVSADSSSGNQFGNGIYLYQENSTYQAKVAHNTVIMRGAPIYNMPTGFFNHGVCVVDVVNNIFAVYNGAYTPAYFYAGTTGLVQSNIYYVANATPTAPLIYRNTNYTKDNYQTIAGGGTLSSNAEPLFDSLNQFRPSLKLKRGCMVETFQASSMPQVDVFGQNRLQQYATVGAIEHVNANLTMKSMIPFTVPVTAGVQELKFVVQNTSTDTVLSYTTGYKQNSALQSVVKYTSLEPCQLDTVTFSGAQSPSLVARNDFSLFSVLDDSTSFINDDTLKVDVRTSLSGTYTVGGSSADFNDVKSAVAALQSGINGPVTFVVNPGLYSAQLDISGPVIGADTTHPITITGNDPANSILQSDTSIATIRIRNIPNIHINGVTIKGGWGGGVSVDDRSAYAKTSFIRISNCIVSSLGTSLNFVSNYDSLVIDSNTITNGSTGIYVAGNTSLLTNRANFIRGNKLSNISEQGIRVSSIYNPINVTGNTVTMKEYQFGNSGIIVYYTTDGASSSIIHTVTVSNNRVNRFTSNGIYVSGTGNYFKSKIVVNNNSVVSATNLPSSSSELSGIKIWINGWSGFATVLHNSVVMQGTSTNSQNAAMYMQGYPYDIRNNIFAIYSGGAVPLYFTDFQWFAPSVANFNLYYNTSSTLPRNIIKLPGGTRDSSNYKTYGGDSSFILEPPFVNRNYFPANLALTNYCTMPRGENLGGLLSADIDYISRMAFPSVGAFEHVSLTNNVSLKQILSPVTSDTLTCGMHPVQYLVLNAGTDTISQYMTHYSNNNGTVYSQLRTVSLPACAIDTVTLPSTYLGVTNELLCYTSTPDGAPDSDRRADTSRLLLQPRLAGEFIVGPAPSDFLTITNAVQRLNKGVGGAVKFRIKTGNYKEYLGFNTVSNSSPVNTITFTSYANHRDSVRIYDVWNGSSIPGGALVNINSNAEYLIFDQLTFDASGGTVDYTLKVFGTASFDTVRNCIIKQNYTTTSAKANVYGTTLTGTGLCLESNQISGSYTGINFAGTSRVNPMKNFLIRNNEFVNGSTNINNFNYCRTCEVSGNTFSINSASSSSTMQFTYVDSAFRLMGNTFNFIGTATPYVIVDNTQNDSAQRTLISNNVFMGNGSTTLDLRNTFRYVDVVHNTLSGTGVQMYFNITSGSSGVRVLNNIMSGTSSRLAFSTSALPLLECDYNSVLSYEVNFTTLTPIQFKSTYAPKEANSVNVSAGLTSASNLMPNSSLAASWSVNGKGVHIGYALNDRNNIPRPQTFSEGAPDIGAYEFTPVSVPQTLTVATINSSSRAFLLGIDTMAKISWTGTTMTGLTGRVYTGVYPPGVIDSLQKSLNQYWDFSGPSGTNTFDLSLYYRKPLRGTNPSFADMIGAKKAGSNPWTLYQGTSVSIDTVRNILTFKGLTDFGIFTGTDKFIPLPVKLLEFTGVPDDRGALLQWKTASEKQASFFEIHASDDGANYQQISENIPAKGNSNTIVSYQYTDEQAFARVSTRYYRLRIVDTDGNYAWNNTVAVSAKSSSGSNMVVFPNPFSNKLVICTGLDEEAAISVIDIQGRTVYTGRMKPENGRITLDMPEGLKAGVYFLQVKAGNQLFTRKLIRE